MALFSEIVGQEHIKEHLQGAIVSRMTSHAYIIAGETGMGKSLIARTFVNGLMCERGEAEPCLSCHSCKQVLSDNHPDVKILIPEKPNIIKVDEVRKQIINDIEIKPYSSAYKIYIIPAAERMNPAAQNALLKTLEEPPAYAVILLLCSSPSLMLDTIVSRCVTLELRPLKDEQVCDFLMKRLQIPDYKAGIMAAFARGNIGRAMLLAGDEKFDALRFLATDILKGIKSMDISRISSYVGEILSLETAPEEFLDYLLLFFRDVLIYKATKRDKDILLKEDIRLISQVAKDSSYEGIEKILKEISQARDRLRVNVNKELTMELVLLNIKEN